MKSLNFIVLLFCVLSCSSEAQKTKVIVDADTGNEIDDFFAIVMALKSKNVDVIGLTAAHWNNQWAPDYDTMLKSWELNNQILEAMEVNIPSLKGSNTIVGAPWSGIEPRKSEATDFIIKSALSTKEGEKLKIICLGAATNIASSILINPDIIERIAIYYIGAKYDFENNAWDKNEFNVRNDLNAFDALLNEQNLELHILTNNISDKIVFNEDETLPRFNTDSKIEKLLLNRWKTWVTKRKIIDKKMYDIGIVEAVINPQLLQEIEISTPPENTPRKIGVYSEINIEAMKNDFWELLKAKN